jgi:hypothetical protein
MGYRSNVVAVFYAQDRIGDEHKERNERNRAKLKLFVEANFPDDLRGSDGDGLDVFDTPTRLLYEFKNTDVKWYDSYPEVIAFEQFWDSFGNLCTKHIPDAPAEDADTESVDWAAEFIRLGENVDDVEDRSSGEADWLLRVSRTIETDY